VSRLHGNLAERGFAAVALSGELSQSERNRALQGLRDGRARVCVATDVAARGIDLPDLGLVIHAELPTDPETLLHRSGRTGRAGRKGVSALMVAHNRRRAAERLLQRRGCGPRGRRRPARRTSAPATPSGSRRRRWSDRRGSGGGRPRTGPRPAGRAPAGSGGRRAGEAAARARCPAPEELAEVSDGRPPRAERAGPPRRATARRGGGEGVGSA
jgi:ATP-dependent RNA helicase DeaD